MLPLDAGSERKEAQPSPAPMVAGQLRDTDIAVNDLYFPDDETEVEHPRVQ